MSVAASDRPSADDNLLQEALDVINQLATKSAGRDYLYRGEPQCYPKVSSGLYRTYSRIDAAGITMELVQQEMLENAKEFIGQTRDGDDDEVLDQLQHYGYTTNLIDFTTDYHIALFFACDGHPQKNGRVILLSKADYRSRKPTLPVNRVISQKSVFVQPRQGFVDPSDIVVIPNHLKDRILTYLEQEHSVAARTIYNDLHGFIRYTGTHQRAYAEFYEGLIRRQEGKYDAAIKRYSKSIDLNRRLATSFSNRGAVYARKGNHERAIQDYNTAIALNPLLAGPYANRGAAYAAKGDYDRAIKDCDRAIELNPFFALAFNNRGVAYRNKCDHDRAIQDFDRAIALEQITRRQLPIAPLPTQAREISIVPSATTTERLP